MRNYKEYLEEYMQHKLNCTDYNTMSTHDKAICLDNAGKNFSNKISAIEKLDKFFTNRELVMDECGFNTSSIYSFLIKKAAEHCRHYASDLFIDLRAFENFLKFNPMRQFNYYLGFRDSGVDHDIYIANKISCYGAYGSIRSNYREIYMIEVHKDHESMKLYKVF